MTDHANELRRYARKIAHPAGDVPSVMLAAADEIERLAARLEATEEDRARFLVEMGRLCAQCDALRAKVAEMERQEPIGYMPLATKAALEAGGTGVVWNCRDRGVADEPLYALPGAQPAPSVPDAWKLVPIEPTEAMVTAFAELFNVRDQKNTFGPAFRAALAAAPEAKP